MSNPERERPRFQFSLRKLLLWVAIEAVLLGTLKMLGLNAVGLTVATLWVAVVALARVACGGTPAVILSQLGGIALAICLWRVLPIDDPTVTLLVVLGGGAGLIPIVFVEIAQRGVDWVDGLCEREGRGD
jgi:hypothetical protein